MNEYYIYNLIDPRTHQVFYVGKGKSRRMFSHENNVRRGIVPNKNKHLFYKIKEIHSAGLNVHYKKVSENLSEDGAWLKEIENEKELRAIGVKLCNLVPCGNGGDTLSNHPNKADIYRRVSEHRPKTRTAQWRKNIGLGLLGTKHSSESRRLRSEKLRGKNNPMFGKTPSDDTIEKIRNATRGRVVSTETREKLSVANRGKVRTEEMKEHLRIVNTGKVMSNETRLKMSHSHIGLVMADGTKEKLRIANTGKVRTAETKTKLSELAKLKIGNKNPNYRPLSVAADEFIRLHLDKAIYWVFSHLPEKASYHRVKRRIEELKHST